jgi:hypothetical protein
MKRSAALRVEALEDRSVPAGTVTISGWGTGNINVIGDPQDNQIEITQPGGPATLRITGLSGTTLALGTIPASWVSSTVPSTPPFTQVDLDLSSVSLVINQLFVDLRAGNDTLSINGVTTAGNLIAASSGNTGSDNDVYRLGADHAGRALLIRDIFGSNRAILDAVTAQDPSTIFFGAGNDFLLIAGSGTIFANDLNIFMGAGSDIVRFVPGTSLIQGNLLINTTSNVGDGGDAVLIEWATSPTAPPTLQVDGNTTIVTGNGADLVRFGFGTGTGSSAKLGATANNTVNINTGNHNDKIFASRVQFPLLTVLLGNGDDQVLNNWGTAGVSVAPGSVIDGGPHVSGDTIPWTPPPPPPPGLTAINFP